MPIYSYSRLNTYEICPRQYEFRYIERPEVEEEGIELFLGSRVHETLKKLYDDVMFNKQPSLFDLLEDFKDRWDKNWHPAVKIVRAGRTPEDYKGLGIKCISDYYNRYQPFASARTIATERRIHFSIKDNTTSEEFQWQGQLDRIDRIDDGVFEIHDYKTSLHLPSQQQVDDDWQLALYEIALRYEFPAAKKVILVLHYLVHDAEIRSVRAAQQLEDLREKTIRDIKAIEASEDANHFPMNVEQPFPCNYCPYQRVCPAWKPLFLVEELPVEQFLADEGMSLVNQYAELYAQQKVIEEKLESTKKFLIELAKAKGVTALRGSDAKVTIAFREQRRYPSSNAPERAELEKFLHENDIFHQVCILNITGLDNKLERSPINQELKDQVRAFGTIEESATVRLTKLTQR